MVHSIRLAMRELEVAVPSNIGKLIIEDVGEVRNCVNQAVNGISNVAVAEKLYATISALIKVFMA